MDDVSDDLAERIEERKREAAEKRIRQKAETVARQLGEASDNYVTDRAAKKRGIHRTVRVSTTYTYRHPDNDIGDYPRILATARRDEPAHRITIETDWQERVFRYEDGDITVYVPGDWEDDIEAAYPEAQALVNAQESENWGIDP